MQRATIVLAGWPGSLAAADWLAVGWLAAAGWLVGCCWLAAADFLTGRLTGWLLTGWLAGCLLRLVPTAATPEGPTSANV